jgi:hypothetical protein
MLREPNTNRSRRAVHHSNRRFSSQMMSVAAASPVAQSVVQPKFQQVLSSASLASLLARKNPTKFSSAMLQAASAPSPPRIGLTYFPPMNCNPTIVAPEPSKSKIKFSAPAAPLPAYFNWADNGNVAESKNWGRRDAKLGSYVSPPPNQLTCGSCWAVASATVFSDRWAIFTQGPNPRLSATQLLSCVSDGSSIKGTDLRFDTIDGCNGGIPAGAAELMARNGIVSAECASYAWCDQNGVCSGRASSPDGRDPGKYLNTSVVPTCAAAKQCLQCTGPGGACTTKGVVAPKVYKARRYARNAFQYSVSNPNIPRVTKTTSKGISFSVPVINDATSAAISLTNVTDIKNELFANGPVVGAMAVFADFQAGSGQTGDDWAPTKNVYCNVQTPGRRPYQNTRYAGVEDNLTGYHAVSIVGWGVENDVDDWEHPGAKISIPYWIVRNSWSPAWNANCRVNNGAFKMPGFFKCAVTSTAKNINTQVYLDRSDNGALGGATAFEPDVARALPPPLRGGPVSPTPPAPPAPPAPACPACPPPPPPRPAGCAPCPASSRLSTNKRKGGQRITVNDLDDICLPTSVKYGSTGVYILVGVGIPLLVAGVILCFVYIKCKKP